MNVQRIVEIVKTHNLERFILTANGSSMTPVIVKGDRLHVSTKNLSNIKNGDIVLCRTHLGQYLIHRVIQTVPEILTQGDTCSNHPDKPIDEVIGIVQTIEKTWRSRLRRWTLKLRIKKKGKP